MQAVSASEFMQGTRFDSSLLTIICLAGSVSTSPLVRHQASTQWLCIPSFPNSSKQSYHVRLISKLLVDASKALWCEVNVVFQLLYGMRCSPVTFHITVKVDV